MRKLLLLSIVSAFATAAHASDAYSSFGESNLSDTGSTYLLGANSLYDFGTVGFQFTATATGSLTGLTAAIHNKTATTPLPLTLAIYADTAGAVGSQLGSWATTSSTALDTASANAVTVATASGLTLTAGTTYWFVATNPDATVANDLTWNSATTVPTTSKRYALRSSVSNPTATTPFYYASNLGAFSVQVNAVPEPASFAALGVGALALLRRRR